VNPGHIQNTDGETSGSYYSATLLFPLAYSRYQDMTPLFIAVTSSFFVHKCSFNLNPTLIKSSAAQKCDYF